MILQHKAVLSYYKHVHQLYITAVMLDYYFFNYVILHSFILHCTLTQAVVMVILSCNKTAEFYKT